MADSKTSENDFFSSRKFKNYSWSFNDRFNFPQFIKLRSVSNCLPFVRDVLVHKKGLKLTSGISKGSVMVYGGISPIEKTDRTVL